MTTNEHPPFGIDPATPSFLNRATAEYEFSQARAATDYLQQVPGWVTEASAKADADLAGSMARHPAGRDLPQWRRVTRAENVQALWTTHGLHLAYWDHGVITTLALDEAAQQTLRDALGVGR